jgi:chromate transporter
LSPTLTFALADWFSLFGHFLMLSLLAVGGAISTVPDMHRYLVTQQAWLTDAQFTSAIALAQAAPGPNVLFVAMMGWQVGLNTPLGLAGGLLGVMCTMLGMLIPSTTLTWAATRWAAKHQHALGVRAFKAGMAPIVVGLTLVTAWLLIDSTGAQTQAIVVASAVALLVWKTQTHMLLLLCAGAALGVAGVL